MHFRGSQYLGLNSVALIVFFLTHVNSLLTVVKKDAGSYFSSTFYASWGKTLLLGMAVLL